MTESLASFYYSIKHLLVGDTGHSAYMTYRSLTGYPYGIVVPFLISLLIALLAWKLTGRMLKKDLKARFLVQYLFVQFGYIAIMIAVMLLLSAVIGHLSPFWGVAFIFYGLQVILPVWWLSASISAQVKPKGSFSQPYLQLHGALRKAGTMLASIILLISFYAWFIEPYQIEVTHHQFQFEDEIPLRIAHLTDLQTDVKSRREEEVVQIVRELKPDVIVLTGDYFNGGRDTNPLAFASARYVLENLSAPLGIYAVSSDSNLLRDHEPLFEGLPITYLENRSVKISVEGKDLYIVGVSRRKPDVELAWKGVPDSANKLLIYHGPEIFFEESTRQYKPQLTLVGHTHGGQISLPIMGALTSGTPFGPEYAKGWFEHEGMHLFVNRGIGLEGHWAPRIRFLTPPEIAVIELGKGE